MSTGPISPVAYAFPHIQWDALGALRLSAQETALLRYVESNPIDYAVAEAQDASGLGSYSGSIDGRGLNLDTDQ